MRKLSAYVLIALSIAFVAPEKGLKDYYKNYFPIGVAVNPRMVQPGPDAELIKAQFNSMTPENAMKMGPIHPEENRYNWKDADAIADFAQQNNIKLRGHTLCWHNQTPRWFFTDSTGKTVSRDILLARLKRHIANVMGRYKGKLTPGDVVNEAVPDTETGIYRKSKFYEIIGEDYIEKAFQYAHEADRAIVLQRLQHGNSIQAGMYLSIREFSQLAILIVC